MPHREPLFCFEGRPPRWQRDWRAGGLVALAGAVAGCASFDAAPLSERPAHTRANRQEKRDLTVAAELYAVPRHLDLHFGPDLWDSGFFAVALYLENRGDDTVEVRRDAITLWLELAWPPEGASREGGPQELKPADPSAVVAECRHSQGTALLLAPFLVLPALWAHEEIAEYNQELARDLLGKAFPRYWRLEKADPPAVGAVFFRRPQGGGDLQEALRSAELHLDVGVEGSRIEADSPSENPSARKVGETISFVLTLSESEY